MAVQIAWMADGGRDTLLGGPGRDRIVARGRTRDRINGGPGFDRAVVDRGDGVRGCERTRHPRR